MVADNTNTNNANQIASIIDFVELEEKTTTAEEVLERLNLQTHEERVQLELDTRSQSECERWHEARRVCITGSKFGRVIIQKEKTIPLLRFCLYPKPMIHYFGLIMNLAAKRCGSRKFCHVQPDTIYCYMYYKCTLEWPTSN